MQGSMLYRPVCTFFVTSIHIPNVNYADSFMNFTYYTDVPTDSILTND